MLGTSTNPKAQCRICSSYGDVGIVYCACGHFLRNGTEKDKKPVEYTMDPRDSQLHKERVTPRALLREEARDRECFIANSFKRKCQKMFYLDIDEQFIRDGKFHWNIFDASRTEEMCRKMDE